MPYPYILQVFSQPTAVSDEVWTQWYLEEHIRDMVYFGVVKTASFYHAMGSPLTSKNPPSHESEETSFLAHFQTEGPKPLSSPNFKEKVRQATQLFDGKRGREVGRLKDTASQLTKVTGTEQEDETAASHVVQLIMKGEPVDQQVDSKITTHISDLEGYQRVLEYRPAQPSANGDTCVVLIFEFKSLDLSKSPDVHKAIEEAVRESKCALRLRAYELLGSEGFGGECRVPARL